MIGERPERVPPKPTKPKIDKLLPVAVGPKKPTPWDAVVIITGDGEDRPWRSGDPVPITGTASFGATGVTITVSIPADASRSDFKLYVTQIGWTPSTTTSAIATSLGQPAGGALGSSWTYPGTPAQDLTIQLTFKRSGATFTVSCTIPGTSIIAGTSVPFVLA